MFSLYCDYVVCARGDKWFVDGNIPFPTYDDAIAYVDSLNNY